MNASLKKPMLVVHLDPTSVNACWFARGDAPRRLRVPLVSSEWAACWEAGLRPIDDALAEAVTRLGVPAGVPVCVGFESLTGVAEAQSIPAGDARSGLASLRLAMCERLSLPRRSQTVRVNQVSRARGENPGSGVAIVSAASESDVEAVHAWIERAGLRCAHLVPSGAVLLEEVTREVLAAGGGPGRIVLHIDGHRSVLGVSAGGRIELLRTFEIGTNNLAEAVVRAAQTRGESRTLPLSLAQALECLFKHGLPRPGTEFDAEHRLGANAVLPVLQPVLQRLCVEVKQSLRMVMRRSGNATVRVELRGPGANIPHLAAVIGESVEVECAAPADAAKSGSLEAMLHRPGWQDLALTSAGAVAEFSSRRFRRAVVLGALLGVAALGAEAAHYMQGSASLLGRMRAVGTELVEVRQFGSLSSDVVDLDGRLARGRNLLNEFVGPQPDWNAAVTALALAAKPRVEITEIRGTNESEGADVLLYGIADATNDSAVGLTSFTHELEQSPLFERVDVESRVLLELDNRAVYQFRIRVALGSLRPELMTMELSHEK